MSLFSELKRRNVLRVGTAYAAVSWLAIQIVETVFPLFGLSDTAARYFEQAMKIDPNNVTLLRVVSLLLGDIGRTDEAIAVGNYLILRDPSCLVCIGNLAYIYRSSGRHEEAIEALEKTLKWTDPSDQFHWPYGVILLVAGHPGEALDSFEKITDESQRELGSVMALHDLGRTEEFKARFAAMQSKNNEHPEGIARVYAWTGNNDKAFEWIEKVVAVRGPSGLVEIDTDLYQKIKSDPRWSALREKYGIQNPADLAIEFNFTLPIGANIN